MNLLNIGSIPLDGASTKASSLSPVKPIGSGFSSPFCQPVLRDGPPFSTDADLNGAETRFGVVTPDGSRMVLSLSSSKV